MRVLLVADGRSPITRRWIGGLLSLHHEVTLVSTFPCSPVEGTTATYLLPVAFSGMAGSQAGGTAPEAGTARKRKMVSKARSLFMLGRYILGPLTLPFYAGRFRSLVRKTQPDLVHALRIPFEGMLASYTPREIPLLVSIWGNDLTLHAKGSGLMRSFTARTLRRTNGLLADTNRDIRLAKLWGFSDQGDALVVPGAGGIDLFEIHNASLNGHEEGMDSIPKGAPLVVNPRGFRPGSVCNDTFFQSIPLILERRPDVRFLCPAMAGQAEAVQWIQRLHIKDAVRLLPYLSQPQLWDIFLRANVSVSVSEHDGTPNSLLEAMACGCFPVVGDIESLREWIIPGRNGLLVEPNSPQALAEAVLLALESPDLRSKAADTNLEIIRSRAESGMVQTQIECFYRRFVTGSLSFGNDAGDSRRGSNGE